MYVISITYIQPIDVVEKHLQAHRDFLRQQYAAGYLIMSGPKNPRDGGVIIANAMPRNELDQLIAADPFCQYEVADYQVTEFEPVLHDMSNFTVE